MSNLSQVQKIVEFLKTHKKEKFNARQIAEAIIAKYPEDYQEKRNNEISPRIISEENPPPVTTARKTLSENRGFVVMMRFGGSVGAVVLTR